MVRRTTTKKRKRYRRRLLGLIIGLVLAGSVYWWWHRTPQERPTPPKKVSSPKPAASEAPRQFEFYHLLPNMGTEQAPKARASRPAPKITSYWWVEVKLLNDDKAADALRAHLLLHGFQAQVKRLQGTQRLVVVGPFVSEAQAIQYQKRLEQQRFPCQKICKFAN